MRVENSIKPAAYVSVLKCPESGQLDDSKKTLYVPIALFAFSAGESLARGKKGLCLTCFHAMANRPREAKRVIVTRMENILRIQARHQTLRSLKGNF